MNILEVIASLSMVMNFNPFDIGNLTYLDFEMQTDVINKRHKYNEKQAKAATQTV
jgi:hypothetical protein